MNPIFAFATLLWTGTLVRGEPIPRACPAHDGPWAEARGRTCTALADLVAWRDVPPAEICHTPHWRYGPSAAPAVLYSAQHAQDVAALLPPAGAAVAWLGLSAQLNASTGRAAWQWNNTYVPMSEYGLSDATAWAGGVMPPAALGSRAALRVDGLLQVLPCNTTDAPLNYTACSLPACTCNSSSCTTPRVLLRGGARSGSWLIGGHTCVPVDHAEFRLDTITDSESDPASALCSDPLAPSEGSPRVISSLFPGDEMVLCGKGRRGWAYRNSDGSSLERLHLRVKWNTAQTAAITSTFEGRYIAEEDWHDLQYQQSARCLPWIGNANCTSTAFSDSLGYVIDIARVARQWARADLHQVIAAGDGHVCAILAQPYGAVRCAGANDVGQATVPADLPPAAMIAAHGKTSCAVLVMHGYMDFGPAIRCWGAVRFATSALQGVSRAVNFRGISSLSLLHTGNDGEIICATRMRKLPELAEYEDGAVTCWGEPVSRFPIPSDLAASSMVRVRRGIQTTCSIDSKTYAVRCWGYDGMAWRMPKSYALALGRAIICAAAVGSGNVTCWVPEDIIRPDLPWTWREWAVPELPPVSVMVGGEVHVCAILAATGLARCFGGRGQARVPNLFVPPDLGPVEALASSTWGMCAVQHQTGAVRCWDPMLGEQEGLKPYYEDNVLLPPTPPGFRALLPSSPMRGMFQAMSQAINNDDNYPLYGFASYADAASAQLVDVVELLWTVAAEGSGVALPDAVTLRTAKVSSRRGSAPFLRHTYKAGLGLHTPAFFVYTQDDGFSQPKRDLCHPVTPLSAYLLECSSPRLLYGAEVQVWNGSGFQREVFPRTRSPYLLSASAGSSVNPSMDLAGVNRSLFVAIGSHPASVVGIRPGASITLRGHGFGLHAALLQDVPWWKASASGVLRSCIHLAWWTSPASYHNDSACVCNGLEDWLGEGELPLASIQSWDDTSVTFIAPLGEGIREVRLCVEGRGQVLQPARSNSSVFLVFEPPGVLGLFPGTFLDSTETDTELSLQVSVMADNEPMFLPTWGTCAVQQLLPVSAGMERAMFSTAIDATTSFRQTRHCVAAVVVTTSLGSCFLAGRAQGSVSAPLATACRSAVMPVSKISHAVERGHEFFIQLPETAPNALLNMTLAISVWDGGIEVALTDASIVLRRTLPVLRSVTPNPVLLGPFGGPQTPPLILTLFGAGFRTAQEIDDPRQGLAGVSRELTVHVDDVACRNATAVRFNTRFAYVTCVYPSALLGGGSHALTLTMIGVNSTLASADGTTAGFSTACAPGYYGQFGVPGHQECWPCPRGALCTGGVGEAPAAQAGYYNLGLPAADRYHSGNRTVMRFTGLRNVSSLGSAECPQLAGGDGGRGIACVQPCDPPAACLGDNECADGYESVAPSWRCAQCSRTFYRSSGVCVRCPVIGLASLLLLLLAMLCIAAAMYILSSNAIKLCTLNIVVEYAQILTLLQGPRFPWPAAVRNALFLLSVLRINVEVASPECISELFTPETKLWTVVILPLLIVATGVLALVGFAACKIALEAVRALNSRSQLPNRARCTSAFWLHAPAISRTVLKLLGTVYLPVVQASLAVFDCTPTEPPDGKEYLSIIPLEECGKAGGRQELMFPWAFAGLLCYGALYPMALCAFFFRFHDHIVEDQLLFAAGTGDSPKTNVRAHVLRQYLSPLYQDYAPGYHYAALLTLARRALVCVCALMLNKSPPLQASCIVLIVVVCLTVHAVVQPLMTPGKGHSLALARFAARLNEGEPGSAQLRARIAEIAAATRVPALIELAAGQAVCSDVTLARQKWWAHLTDANLLECSLQLQIVLVGLLSVIYQNALTSVFSERAVPVVTALFFMLLALAILHIATTVGYELVTQFRRGLSELAGVPAEQLSSWSSLLLLFCCRCCFNRSRARAVLLARGASAAVVWPPEADHAAAPDKHASRPALSLAGEAVFRWVSSPIGHKAAAHNSSVLHSGPPHSAAAVAGQARGTAQDTQNPLFSSAPAPASTPLPDPSAVVPQVSCAHHSVPAPPSAPVLCSRLSASAAGMGVSSQRLLAIQRSSRFVQVDVDDVLGILGPPSAEEWGPIRASYAALWDLVEFEQRAAQGYKQEAEMLRRQNGMGSSTP